MATNRLDAGEAMSCAALHDTGGRDQFCKSCGQAVCAHFSIRASQVDIPPNIENVEFTSVAAGPLDTYLPKYLPTATTHYHKWFQHQ